MLALSDVLPVHLTPVLVGAAEKLQMGEISMMPESTVRLERIATHLLSCLAFRVTGAS